MALTDLEVKIVCKVVGRFLNSREATIRTALNREFEDPDAINRLKELMLLKTFDGTNYLPTALSFHCCKKPEIEAFARRSIEVMARIFRDMYMDGDSNVSHENLTERATRIDAKFDERMLRLGLYLAPDFRLLSSFTGGNQQQTDIAPITISEDVLRLRNIEGLWDNFISELDPWAVRGFSGGIGRSRPMFHSTDDAGDLAPYEEGPDNDITEEFTREGSAGLLKGDKRPLLLISHSSRDEELIRAVIDLILAALPLSSEQIRCTTVDGYRLPLGAQTDQQLREEVIDVKLLIGVLTPNSLKSSYVLFELGARWGARRPMFPLWAGVDAETVSGPIKGMNAALCNNHGHLLQFVEEIGQVLGLFLRPPSFYRQKVEAVVEKANVIGAAFNVDKDRIGWQPVQESSVKSDSLLILLAQRQKLESDLQPLLELEESGIKVLPAIKIGKDEGDYRREKIERLKRDIQEINKEIEARRTGDAPQIKSIAREWRTLAAEFQRIQTDIRAEWNRDTNGVESWDVRGGGQSSECEAFCKLAGATLLISPRIAASLSAEVLAESNALFRWLYFLKGKNLMRDHQHGLEVVDGKERKPFYFGAIRELGPTSYRICIECSAIET